MFYQRGLQINELQWKLDLITNPEVAVKDVEKEVFKVKSWNKKDTFEKEKKRKLDYDKEFDEIAVLRDAPPSKFPKITPALHPKPPSSGSQPGSPKPPSLKSPKPPSPRSPKPPSPGSPDPSPGSPKMNISKQRSTSPRPLELPEFQRKNVLKRERSKSPQPVLPPISPNKPLVVSGQRKKRKKEKEKKKT